MVKIDCNNNITVTRGDKGFINFRCANYKLKKGDRVTFHVDDPEINIVVTEFTDNGIACIDIEKEHTTHDKGEYEYAIRVETTLGVDETVVFGKYVIL